MVGTVKIVGQYKTVNSSYELAVQGKYNLVEVLRMQVGKYFVGHSLGMTWIR